MNYNRFGSIPTLCHFISVSFASIMARTLFYRDRFYLRAFLFLVATKASGRLMSSLTLAHAGGTRASGNGLEQHCGMVSDYFEVDCSEPDGFWCLNFRGRVTVASVKNFQFIAANQMAAGGPSQSHPSVWRSWEGHVYYGLPISSLCIPGICNLSELLRHQVGL